MKKHNITETKLKLIVEDRLSLQSTKRALELYNLPKYTLPYFTSKEFINNYFNQWDQHRQKEFLKLVGGNEYWLNFKKILDINTLN